MKKGIIVGMASLILLTSCGTYTSTGASLGGILGSAIGGIAGCLLYTSDAADE